LKVLLDWSQKQKSKKQDIELKKSPQNAEQVHFVNPYDMKLKLRIKIRKKLENEENNLCSEGQNEEEVPSKRVAFLKIKHGWVLLYYFMQFFGIFVNVLIKPTKY
jgi:hypothetical protein